MFTYFFCNYVLQRISVWLQRAITRQDPKTVTQGPVLAFTGVAGKLTSRETSSCCSVDSITQESVIKGQKREESFTAMYFLDSCGPLYITEKAFLVVVELRFFWLFSRVFTGTLLEYSTSCQCVKWADQPWNITVLGQILLLFSPQCKSRIAVMTSAEPLQIYISINENRVYPCRCSLRD